MTRTQEKDLERKRAATADRTLHALESGLADAVGRSGGVLNGFSIKGGTDDTLLILRASFPGGEMVAFVGSYDAGACVRKAVTEGQKDGLRWRADRFRSNGS